MSSLYIQYGCGLCAPVGWRNFDASPTLRLQRLPIMGDLLRGRVGPVFPDSVEFGDIVAGLPLADGTCQGVYCSHVLEHLSLEDLRAALTHTYGLLQAGGTFRFVMPDLEILAHAYLDSAEPEAALAFMEHSCLGVPRRARGLAGLVRGWLGNSAHLWMWDYKSIVPELEKMGFQRIRRAEFGDSEDVRFNDVEDANRWQTSLGVECVR